MAQNSIEKMVNSSPAIKSSTLGYGENFTFSKGGILNIYGNCTSEEIQDIIKYANHREITLIQFARKFDVTDLMLDQINQTLLQSYPNSNLSVNLNGFGAFTNLNFLSRLSELKNLTAHLFGPVDLSPINKFTKLHSLGIGGDRSNIQGITEHTTLRELFIIGKPRGVKKIGMMTRLEKLSFSRMTFKELDFLRTLNELKELHFILGGTKNLSALPEIGKIEMLSFLRVRELKVEHLEPINRMAFLTHLKFDTQPHLTDLNWLQKKSIQLEVVGCKNFKN